MAFVDENGVVSLASDLRTFADATYPANAAIAPAYDSTATYDIGDYCLYSGLLYKCNTAIEEGGEAWDSTHWTQVVLVNEKISKSGDTMTGDLSIVDNKSLQLKGNIAIGDTPSETVFVNQQAWQDVNGTKYGLVRGRFATDGKCGLQVGATRGNVNNLLQLNIDGNGNRTITVSEQAPWLAGIGAVAKAGDTMTGNLTLQGEDSLHCTIKNTAIDISASTATDAKVMTFRGLDKNGRYVGWCQAAYNTAGRSNISLGARKYINSANVDNTLTLAVLADGTKTVSVTDSSIWRSALGVVNKAGDTMTGILKLSSSTTIANNTPARLTFEVTQTDNNVTYSNCYIAAYDTHQASSSGLNVVFHTGGNLIIGGGESPNAAYTNVYKDTSTEKLILTADNIIEIYTNAGTWANAVKTSIDTSGNFSGKAANVTGTVAIANGGTGQTAVSTVTTLSSIATAASGVTISVSEYHQWGKLAYVRLELTKTAAISSNTLVATMVSGKRPVMDASAWLPEKTGAAWILKGGGIYVTGDFSANKNIVITSLFMLP